MALSPQWSQPVTVRSDGRGGELSVVQPSPQHSSARAYAAAGNPIIVRVRDPHVFTAPTSGGSGGDGASGDGNRNALVTAIIGRDISETFWVPDVSKHEVGLLETLHRRGSNNRTHVLLQSRPLAELQYNFSTCTNSNIDLSHNAFRLSKTAMALHHMDRTLGDDDEFDDSEQDRHHHHHQSSTHRSRTSSSGSPSSNISMSTKNFKAAMRASLQSLQEEDYYVVKYRDYSSWAVSEYKSITRNDSMFGRKYVEQCFAVHVGREPGELIPITESQFLFAVDILQRQLLNQLDKLPKGNTTNEGTYRQYQVDINYSALNPDQFRSLGALLGDGLRPVGVEGEERKREEEARKEREAQYSRRGDYHYDAPAWYDWTPGAVRRRVQHQLAMCYASVGRMTVQALVIGICGYYVYRGVRDYLPDSGSGQDNNNRGGNRRGGNNNRQGRRGGGDYYYNDDDEYYVRRGFLRSVLMGPKEVMDYMLAPRDMPPQGNSSSYSR